MLIPVKPCSFNHVSRLLMLCACVFPWCTRFFVFVLMLVNKLVVSFAVLCLDGAVPPLLAFTFVLLIAVFEAAGEAVDNTVLVPWVRFLRAACCASRVCVAF